MSVPETSAPSTTAPPDRASTTRARIVAVARKHFSEHGYDGTSMRQIAAEVGVNVATLYFHCSTKEQLFFAVLDARRERLWDGLQTAIATAGPTWSEQLAAAITFHVEFSCGLEAGPIATARQLRRLPGAVTAGYIARRDEYEEQFRRLIRGGIDDGEFAPVDAPVVAAAVLGAATALAQWYRPRGRLTPAQIAASHVELFLGGLRVREAI